MASDHENNGAGDGIRPLVPPVVEQQEDPDGEGETTAAQPASGGAPGSGDQEDSSASSSAPPEADERQESPDTASTTSRQRGTQGGPGGGSSLDLLRGLLGDDAVSDFADADVAEIEPPEPGSGAQAGPRGTDGGEPQKPGDSGATHEVPPPPHVIPTLASYRIEVDFPWWETDDRIKPLNGVNKGVLTYPKYGQTEGRPSVIFDVTRLYQAAGVTSTRLHSDVFDVANILRGVGAFQSGISFLEGAPDPPPLYPADFDGVVADYLARHEGRFFSLSGLNGALDTADVFDDVGDYEIVKIERWEAWLYWYPASEAAVEALGNYVFGPVTGVLASYTALVDGDFEIYFRVGESNQGPSYMGPLIDVLHDPATLRLRYASAAAKILHHLVSSTVDPVTHEATPPRFIEIWNEPNGAGYTGPSAVAENGVDSTPEEWAEDFGGMADLVFDAVGHLAPTAGFGFNDQGMVDFVHSVGGDAPEKVFELLKDVQLSDLPFLSFHVYGMETHPFRFHQPS